MKKIILGLFIVWLLASAGCTSFRPTSSDPALIQRAIVNQGLLQAGERVRITRTDASVAEFRITTIDLEEGLIVGPNEIVRIDEIAGLETRELSWLKTGLLIGGLALALVDTECTDECGYGPYPYYAAYHCCP
jgi:hypothetical protein